MSVVPCHVSADLTEAASNHKKATNQYDQHHVLGSPEKDVLGSRHFKVVGAEVDTSERIRSLGVATVAAPFAKRLAMTVLTLRIASLPVISTGVASRLTGNYTSIFMFRRCLACIINELYAFSSEDPSSQSQVFDLPRSTANELVLASIFSIVAASDVSVKYLHKLYASDASMTKGAVVSRQITDTQAKILWLGGDKRGAYTRLDPPFRELARTCGIDDFEDEATADLIPSKGLSFDFDFVEICGGVGAVSEALSKRGFIVMPPIELSDSPHFDIRDLKLVNWLCNMLQEAEGDHG